MLIGGINVFKFIKFGKVLSSYFILFKSIYYELLMGIYLRIKCFII